MFFKKILLLGPYIVTSANFIPKKITGITWGKIIQALILHVDSINDPEATSLKSLFDCFDLVQHVNGTTHKDGHTLDLVISRATDNLVQSCEVGSFVSDHNAIYITLNCCKPHPIRRKISFRKIRSINTDAFMRDIESSELTGSLPNDVDVIVSRYNRILQELLDKHAPVQTGTIAQHTTQPWMDKTITEAKKKSRKAEVLYRKDKSTDNRNEYMKQCKLVKDSIQRAKRTFFTHKINECGNDKKKTFSDSR